MMALAAIGMLASTLVAYPLAERFSLGMQIAGHLACRCRRPSSNSATWCASPRTTPWATCRPAEQVGH
jgi:hypothetical protein